LNYTRIWVAADGPPFSLEPRWVWALGQFYTPVPAFNGTTVTLRALQALRRPAAGCCLTASPLQGRR